MDSPRNVDDADSNRNANCKLVKPQALQRQYVTAVLRVSGGRPKNEKELPGEGVEVPGLVVGIAMRLPTEVPRQKIDCPDRTNGSARWRSSSSSTSGNAPNKST